MAMAAAPAASPFRRLVNVMAPPVGGAVAWGVQSASHNPQLATVVGGFIIAGVLGVNEYVTERRRPQAERIEEAIRGEAVPSLAVVVLLVVLGILVLENLIGFFVGLGLGLGQVVAVDHLVANGADRGLAEAIMTFTQSDMLLGVMIMLTIPLAITFGALGGIWGGHRIRRLPWLWLLVAAALVQAVNAVTNWAALEGEVEVTTLSLAIGAAVGFALHAIGISIGLIAAKRSQSRFVLGGLFRRLDADDRAALLDAASPIPARPSRPDAEALAPEHDDVAIT